MYSRSGGRNVCKRQKDEVTDKPLKNLNIK